MSPPLTIFLGGSRSIARLHPTIIDRMSRIVAGKYRILVGDADGSDSALQRFLAETGYRDVTVFCSGEHPRKYHGPWGIRRIHAPFCARGYEFHAVKDRAMADAADLGFMIWDGASPGTALNALRLTGQRKPVFIFDSRAGTTIRLDTICDWTRYIGRYPARLRASLRTRATPAEWAMLPAHS
jgi:adenine-specific DNA-methyltransferase